MQEKTHQKLDLATVRGIGSILSNGSRNSSTSKASKRRIELSIGVSKKDETTKHEVEGSCQIRTLSSRVIEEKNGNICRGNRSVSAPKRQIDLAILSRPYTPMQNSMKLKAKRNSNKKFGDLFPSTLFHT